MEKIQSLSKVENNQKGNETNIFDSEIEKMMRDMIHDSHMRGVKWGGLFVIKTLKEAMKISGASYVYPKWLDTAEKELNKQIE